MTIRIAYIPYLNMVPFHQNFGPGPIEQGGHRFEFHSMSPRTLGLEAEKGAVDAGAMSLVDCFRLSETYEPLETFGIGVKRAAQSVLVFSKKPLSQLEGFCAVTDETSTSLRLLQVIVEARYGKPHLRYGRIASSMLFDGEADALLLIGDEALRAKKEGVRGFSVVTDLGEEWFDWQGSPFVFARWMVKKKLAKEAKVIIQQSIQNSLESNYLGTDEAIKYWEGFAYQLTDDHLRSVTLFNQLLEKIYV